MEKIKSPLYERPKRPDITCVKFQTTMDIANLKCKKAREDLYDICVIIAYLKEINRGYEVHKVGVATSKGTKITYVPFEDAEDVENYMSVVRNKIKEFNERWGQSFKSNCVSVDEWIKQCM